MTSPQKNPAEEMYWADYFDSLSEEYFRLRAQAEPANAVAIPEPPTRIISRLEAERELA